MLTKALLQQPRLAAAAMFVALFTLPITAQTTDVVWSEPIPVATSTFGSSSPKIGQLASGEIVAVWGKSGSSPKIYFSRLVNDSFEVPLQLSTGGITPDIYGFGGLGMAVSGNKIFVVFENFDSGVHVLRSEDGGQTFLPPVSVFDPPAGDWTTLASVAADGQGNPIVSVIRELATETEARYIVVRSTDGGASFLPPVIGSEPADGEYVCECCPSEMVVAGDSVWLVFRNNNDNLRDIWVSRSTDAAASFDMATDVDDTDWMVNACPISGPRLKKIGNDSLLAVWMSGATGQGRIYGATLHGGTMEKGWQFGFTPTNASGLQSFPSIAGNGDTLCVVWEESGFGANAGEMLFSFSITGAAGLAAYPPGFVEQAPGNQKYPDIFFDDGIFHLIYQTGGALAYRRGVMAIINSSVEKTPQLPDFELLSNPTTGFVLVKMNEPGQANLALFSSTGQVVAQWPLGAVSAGAILKLPLSTGIPAGLYFLKMEKGGLVWTEKLVVH
ncbi:MAG: T9SS type A sorting domain-containing protein [Saprospiraceae bacterium]|nr:T9SS type A sorting domain-containing protein [Saprospiraceae bacterium]MCF8248933.1 T9SS type A sorting domain-containing protein [Saprospiraceae bacterium]MCF8279144.1 T9SS type A sorting domain-containing protein [Bacteroidales bacterium]MCF8310827.1 T9SS type A sorting domain-containing protein [Saprospiraceae bacterium]MCF8439585.1 T9SS type A sorting domain-containing protein [Saprospiraceae bacterium]